MKLRIQNTALIGDPDLGAELEIPTHGRVFDFVKKSQKQVNVLMSCLLITSLQLLKF